MTHNTTDELLKQLLNVRTTSELSKYNTTIPLQNCYKTFSEYLNKYLEAHQLSESEVIHNSMIPRTYGYQILNGQKNPGRDKVIALCLASHMNLDETERALMLANQGKLYARRKRDSILIFSINKHLDVMSANELLYNEGEEILR